MHVAEMDESLVNEFTGNDADAIILMLTTAKAKGLTPFDAAKGYQRLLDLGMPATEIAQRMHITATTVNNSVQLLKMPYKLQQMISSDRISATLARELFRKHGLGVVGILETQLEGMEHNEYKLDNVLNSECDQSEQAGKKRKITARKLGGKAPKLAKAHLNTMYQTIQGLALKVNIKDLAIANKKDLTITLSKESAEIILSLKSEIDALQSAL
jgi:hypothetical protein